MLGKKDLSVCLAHAYHNRSSSLTLTANLKGAHIGQNLDLYQDLVQSVSTRTLTQEYLKDFNNGNTSQAILDLVGVGRALNTTVLALN